MTRELEPVGNNFSDQSGTEQQFDRFRLNRIDAVSPEYLNQATNTLQQIPVDLDGLKKLVNPQYSMHSSSEDEEKIDIFVNSYNAEFGISKNPFHTILPQDLETITNWLRLQDRVYEYAPRSKEYSKHRSYTYEQNENNYIRVIRGWNEYHVGFLTALNTVNAEERKQQVEAMGEEILYMGVKYKMSGQGYQENPIQVISPQDNATQWMIMHALDVLHSEEGAISPVARFRAIELLAQFPMNTLEQTFFSQHNGRLPSSDYAATFHKELLRLPRSFFSSAEERTNSIHTNWERNQHIQEILGTKGMDRGRFSNYDYPKIFNTLVEKYPKEAIQVTLLMMNTPPHQRAAFAALLMLTKLDPIARQAVFGSNASYLTMHIMPTTDQDRISYALGIDAFDDDLAIEMEGLRPEETQQVLRRYKNRIAYLEERLAETERKYAESYFSSKKSKLQKIDPNGYWRVMGVHPETDPNVLEELLKRSYRVVALQYHPDTTSLDKTIAEAKMKQLNEAYEVLRDSEKRRTYQRN